MCIRSAADATRLLKDNVDLLAPFFVVMYNRSFVHDVVPAAFKTAYITSLLKKSGLNPAANFELVCFVEIVGTTVACQLIDYLAALNLLPDLQSAY